MNFTFGIVTSGDNDNLISNIITDIKSLNVPNYEIIIVGGKNSFDDVNHIEFDENQKVGWITRKKNIITQNAKYENIVYLHDYITFNKNWYINFLKFGSEFFVCMNKIKNLDETRYRDWCLWPGDHEWEKRNGFNDEIQIKNFTSEFLLPYDYTELSKYIYISGAYWVAKKSVMLEFPLNEDLCWGDGEDVEWSLRVRKKYKFSINKKSEVNLLKYKDRIFKEISQESLDKLLEKLNFIDD